MFKRLAVFAIYLVPFCFFAQDFSALWTGYFSFYNIKDVVQGNNKIYAAAENAVFSYDTQTNEIKEITTINGLSGEQISTIYYSEAYQLLMIGYENGLIEIAFDNGDNVLTVVDIIDKQTIPPTSKRINHFNAYGNLVYIATNYGISVFDLDRLEFKDTYFIGDLGIQTKVLQTTIFGDYIYAACQDGNGLRKALVSDPNLIDYKSWQTVTSGDFVAVETVQDQLYVVRTNRRLYQVTNDVLTEKILYNNPPLDVKAVEANLVVTTKSNVFVYDTNFNAISQASVSTEYPTTYSAATIVSGQLYIGTKDFGVLKTALISPIAFEEVHPEGPLRNKPFSIKATSSNLWVTFGDYNLFFNPYPLDSYGFSHFQNDEWINIPYSEVFNAKSLNAIAVNPANDSQVFISSFFSGLLEVNDDVPTILYNETNSGLESLVIPTDPSYVDVRVGPTAFDSKGFLWSVSSLINSPLKSYNPSNNQWVSYSFTDLIPSDFGGNLGFGDIVIGADNTKWVGSYKYGLIGFNENGGKPLLKSLKDENQNMPNQYVTALAMDKRNQLWIGTLSGLRVLYNTSGFFTDDNVQADDIVILEDGIPKELLFEQFISDIEVDGSNNKWVGTIGSGIFYLSYDGQKTIYHFTRDNSPLPSNNINDISIDDTTGEVYIATDNGLVSFHSGGSSPQDNLQNAYAYPNPVRPNFNIVDEKVKIKDISENVNIKITDIEGNLVAEAQSRTNLRYNGYNLEIDGGTAYWNGKNLANNVVASGVYLVMLSDLDTFETRVLKLMIIR
ncbi:ABC transporter substrate-binding protein [Yeosuana aromativorans]|uniref:ABC transporter substrate-binding protein n=1 Tax=Yeosuana aromativorans TaxID=288019 RepID=A0A8J3BQJ1_9FLAO|nr:two-component regulator propeller domain-containing protein [Yeosuana aromativorans]GGK31437.1 ABC transporter substrate-binding protein [Yeosuana aromativorans]